MSEANLPRRARDYRLEARESLRGKWLRLFLPMLLLMLIGGMLVPASVEIPSSSDAGWLAHHIADFSAGGRFTPLVVYDEDYQEMYEYLEKPVPEINITSPRLISLDLRIAAAALVLIAIYFLLLPVYHNASAQLFLGVHEEQPRSMRTDVRKYFRLAGALLLRGILTNWLMWIAAGCRLAMHLSDLAGNPPEPFFLRMLYSLFFAFAGIYALVLSYRYQPIPMLSALNPQLTARELLDHSHRIMSGRKWRLLCLEMSFIGWLLLTLLPSAVLLVLAAASPEFVALTDAWLANPLASVSLTILLQLPLVPVLVYQEASIAAFVREADQKTPY